MNIASSLIRRSFAFRLIRAIRGQISWRRRRFAAPSPQFVKWACLLRNGIPGGTWVETGTYMGETTRLLARHSRMVFSIEPQPELHARASRRLRHLANVEILLGTSEQVMPGLLTRIAGDVSFWLDGHYSAGSTFEASQHTPIVEELSAISANLHRFPKVCVLVDDVRCFDPKIPEFRTYPPVDYLVDWARQHKLDWHIEHDIFCARN